MTGPRHRAARHLVQQGLFENLKSFSDLESRIGALPTKQDRGDAFEVFAEAYLATERAVQAREVWPLSLIPFGLKQHLRLDTAKDMGVDGLIETVSGEHHAYQAKFRSRRAPLTWDELSTFMGLSDQVAQRVLFTNSDDFPELMNHRRGFYCIGGTDLDRLDARDFRRILSWLQVKPALAPKKKPQRHQAQALAAILPALQEYDRATALMACGTGKTLVALWVAEQLGAQRVLVLVPSLALLRQTLHEWLKETEWGSLSYLCVCSDPTVDREEDAVVLRQADVDFPVTTDSRAVKRFLNADVSGVKIIFSTYQSARVVAGGMARGDGFDLGIFDEAHKTAGREGINFGFALKDSNLRMRKRLFLTATPRHYDVSKTDKEGDLRLVYSMDVPEVYGPVVHQLPFAGAARRNIICNYKVIISVVTSEMVTDALLRRGEVVIGGDTIKARHVANQIAIQQAIKKHRIRKVFTFHRTVKSAAAFTGDGSEGIKHHLPTFEPYHVNGAMRTADREQRMVAFRQAQRAVMSNARCLTEGIDVPAVDMVAFLTPKRSRVDIVQAVGRAMRKADGKKTGYVLIPLFVEQAAGESLDAAVARAEFDEVWGVLQAMQEQDEMLADVIRQMREERGRTKGVDDAHFRERVEVLGPEISLDALRRSITTLCLDRLGSSWDERFGQLNAFKSRFGHCNVALTWPENPQLGSWVMVQRRWKKKRWLSTDRVQRLDDIGFLWEPYDTAWEVMFAALATYKQEHGDCNVPFMWKENPQLGSWVLNQRNLKKQRRLPAERISRLEAAGFVWNPFDAAWEERFAELVRYKERHGDCNVPDDCPDYPQLGTWVGKQRTARRTERLSQDHARRLDELGLVWDPIASAWEEMFTGLKAYKDAHGDCTIAAGENPQLASWVLHQRQLMRKKRLPAERRERLDEIGFIWNPHKTTWDDMLAQLRAYRQEHGDCDVPCKWPENPQLGKWVNHQRQFKKSGQLSPDRVQQLEKNGFVWDSHYAVWEQMFAALLAYRLVHGNCNVPAVWPENPQLGRWVTTQRAKKAHLSDDRVRRLAEIGFVWRVVGLRGAEAGSPMFRNFR